jgi:hypothetical protein
MPWTCTLHPWRWTTKLLVTDQENDEIVKAVLPSPPADPRALLCLLEGLALWSGSQLDAAIFAGPSSDLWLAEGRFHDALRHGGSALVRLNLAPDDARPRRRIPGLGDFTRLRQMHGSRS